MCKLFKTKFTQEKSEEKLPSEHCIGISQQGRSMRDVHTIIKPVAIKKKQRSNFKLHLTPVLYKRTKTPAIIGIKWHTMRNEQVIYINIYIYIYLTFYVQSK